MANTQPLPWMVYRADDERAVRLFANDLLALIAHNAAFHGRRRTIGRILRDMVLSAEHGRPVVDMKRRPRCRPPTICLDDDDLPW